VNIISLFSGRYFSIEVQDFVFMGSFYPEALCLAGDCGKGEGGFSGSDKSD